MSNRDSDPQFFIRSDPVTKILLKNKIIHSLLLNFVTDLIQMVNFIISYKKK